MAQPADKPKDEVPPEIDNGGWAEAKNRCPHVVNSCNVPPQSEWMKLAELVSSPVCCINDCDKKENWYCLGCHELFCGRYANKHMNIHYEQSVNKSHCIAMGTGDLSFWCYECDSYINHLTIKKVFEVYEIAHMAKFKEQIPDKVKQDAHFLDVDEQKDNDKDKDNDNDSNHNKKQNKMITKNTKKKKKKKKGKWWDRDEDGDDVMNDYDKAMNDNQYGSKEDLLDYSVKDVKFDQLMKKVCNDTDNDEIQWDDTCNLPNIEPIISQLNHRELFVGPLKQNNTNRDNQRGGLYSMFTQRSGLTDYSLFDQIPSELKLKYMRSAIDKNVHLDRAIGCMMGMGIGDATGAPLEFIPCVDEYKKSYFKLEGVRKWINEQNAFSLKRGQWTDDASMGLCMADSLVLHQQYNGSDIRIRFWNWWNNGYNNAFRLDKNNHSKSSVGLGGNISKSIYSMKHGQIPTPQFMAMTNKDDSGNGSIMRLAPIPVFYSHCIGNQQMIELAMTYAKESSFTTHPGFIAAECCALMTYIIIHAIHRPTFIAKANENTDEEKKQNDDKKKNKKKQNGKENVKVFLENITNKYLKRIESERAEMQNKYKELVKSKEFQYIKNKMEEIEGKNKKKGSWFSWGKNSKEENDASTNIEVDKEKLKAFLEDEDEDNDEDMYEPEDNDEKYIQNAWNKIQVQLNVMQRQIVAKNYIIQLIESKQPNKSTERCWNWKTKYGNLGIDKTMYNRGNRYNGYPNTQGYFGSYCMDGLAMGLHSLYNSTSFGDAIMKAVNMLGDADSTGSIAGQLAGAWYGFKDVFYDKNDQQFLFKQISKWDDYEFGTRAILLYCIGKNFTEKAQKQMDAQKEMEKEKMKQQNAMMEDENANANMNDEQGADQ